MISWSLAREIQIALAREERESLQLWRDSREREGMSGRGGLMKQEQEEWYRAFLMADDGESRS